MGMSQTVSVCVTVVDCDGNPVQGANVEYWDVDPVQDDHLLSADGQTNHDGIDCADLIFTEYAKTPFPAVLSETGGPDLYFKLSHGGVTLNEDPSAGWGPGREVTPGQILNVTLMLCPHAHQRLRPLFTHVGDFHVGLDFDTVQGGLTNKAKNGHGGPFYAFHRTLSLLGQVPAKWGNQQVQYRFLWRHLSPGAPLTAIPLKGSLIGKSELGSRQILWTNSAVSPPVSLLAAQKVQVGPSGSGSTPTSGSGYAPPPLVIAPDAQGWITIPAGVTVAPSTLLSFVTTQAGVHPGGSSTSSSSVGVTGVITFEARTVGTNLPLGTNSQLIRINNWNPIPTLAIVPVPCNPILGNLKLTYKFDHEYATTAPSTASSAVGLTVKSSSTSDGHDATSGLLPTSGARGWSGTHVVEANTNLSKNNKPLLNWQPCPYTVSFHGSVRLTNGYLDADPFAAPSITFCKKAP